MSLDILESIGLGLGLGLAAGFRVVVPFLAISAAAFLGHLPLSDHMAWLGTEKAFIGLSIALGIEILAYSIPWFDNVVDTLALPIAAIAGALAMSIATNQLDPFAQWSLAILAGGSAAATVRGINGFTRLISSATTGGLANVLLAIGELVAAIAISMASFIAPLFTSIIALILLILFIRLGFKAFSNTQQPVPETE